MRNGKTGKASTIFRYKCTYGTLRYRKTGCGEPLLLLHGLDGQEGLSEWDAYIAGLSKHFTVYALEFPGFGFSDKPVTTYSTYMLASVTASFLADIVGGGAYVAARGGSCGAALSASCASPAYFRKLLLISPKNMSPNPSKTAKYVLRLPILGRFVYNGLHPRQPGARYKEKGARSAYISALSGHFGANLPHLIYSSGTPVRLTRCNDPEKLLQKCLRFFSR